MSEIKIDEAKKLIGREVYSDFSQTCLAVFGEKYTYNSSWLGHQDSVIITIQMDDDGKDDLYDGRVRALIGLAREFGKIRDIEFIKSHLSANITVKNLWCMEENELKRVIRKQDKKSVTKRAMMRVYDRIEAAKTMCGESNDSIKPKWIKRIKNQGFDANRRLVICYKTHKNVLGEKMTYDYSIMSEAMKKIKEYFELTEDVSGKLYYELNRVIIRFSYIKKEIKNAE